MPLVQTNVVVPESKEYDLLPADVYQAELLDVELKMQNKYQSSEQEEVMVFTFVIIDEGEHYGRRMWQYAAQKLSKFKGGSNLYKTLVGLRGGVPLSDEECVSPEETCSPDAINALIGKQVRLSIGQQEKKSKPGEFKNVINAFLPIKEELPAFDASRFNGGDAAVSTTATEISFDE